MLPLLSAIPENFISTADYARYAQSRLPESTLAYLSSGADAGHAMQRNREAFERCLIHPRVLRSFASANTTVQLLGKTHPHPIFVAPTAWHHLFHPDGEIATLHGAAALDAPMVTSTLSGTRLEELAQFAPSPLWFQLYFQHDLTYSLDLVRRAEIAGYAAIVVTVDAPIRTQRLAEIQAGFTLPGHIQAANLDGLPPLHRQNQIFGSTLLASAPTWETLIQLKNATHLPIFLKGILTPEDARLAIEHHMDGIIVSNHGGRCFDSAPAALHVLPSISAAVAGAIPILFDSGIRSGSDIFKAIALGADAVLVGRPILHGLACAGALGVAHILQILRHELESTLVFAGCASLAEARGSRLSWSGGSGEMMK